MSGMPTDERASGRGGPGAGATTRTALEHVAEEDTREAIEEPARLIRIASTVQTLLAEVQTTELDEARKRPSPMAKSTLRVLVFDGPICEETKRSQMIE